MSIDWAKRTLTVLTVAPTTIYALSTELGSMLLLHILHIVGLFEFITASSYIVKNKTNNLLLFCSIISTISTYYGMHAFGNILILFFSKRFSVSRFVFRP